MKMKIFSVFDSKAGFYRAPMLLRSKGEALRGFSDIVNDDKAKNDIARHPDDFTLFYLGEFDMINGQFSPLKAHESLGTGVDFLEVKDNLRKDLGMS